MGNSMSFDSSRFTFNPWNDFLGVVMQQGRVQMDSDWNEWLAEFARRIQAGTMDTMGRAVVPATTPNGFKINAFVDGSGQRQLTIGAGRMYVDGLMVENHGPSTSAVWDPALAELSGAPAAPPVATEMDLNYTAQPYLPNASLPTGNGPFLAYLDVWKRPITYLENPELIDSAVGVDTTGRVQMAWQVKLLDVSNIAGVSCATPDSSIPSWESLILASGAQLTTAVVPSATSGPCCLNTATGYTGMENELYRVEIHQSGVANGSGSASPVAATFKWSRDNASVITAVTAITPATNVANNPTSGLTVLSTGRDNVLSFKPGDWIEITDDYLELNGQAGELHQIDSNGVSKALKTIILQTPVSADLQARLASGVDYHTRICRWDQNGKVYLSDGVTVWVDLGAAGSTGQIPVPSPGTTLVLENGVTVTFNLNAALGNFHVGDFWTFPARASDGTVEILTQAPPAGIHHHYTRLSIVTFPSAATDCRTIWPPTVAAGGECACTVCVDAAEHNSGAATIAMAVEKIKSMGGGRICLGPGLFLIRSTLQLEGLELVEFCGQGLATALAFVGNGPAILAESDIGLRIKDLSVFAVASAQLSDTGVASPAAAIGILMRNCIESAVERCAVFAISANTASTAATNTSVSNAPGALAEYVSTASLSIGTMAIALEGFIIEMDIRDNLLSADVGIGQASQFAISRNQAAQFGIANVRQLLVLVDLDVRSNFLPCGVAGVALFGLGDQTQQSLNLFLLEIAFRTNRVLGCSFVGVGIEGVTMPDGAIRVSDNHIDVTGVGIGCGADGAEIADNLITQAMSAASPTNTGASSSIGGAGVLVVPVPGGKLAITQARIMRNRINNYGGPGISVRGGVLISSIVGNSIMFVTQTGIAVAGPAVPSKVIVRENEVFNVVPPASAAAAAPAIYGPQTSGASLGQELSLSTQYEQIVIAPVTGIRVTGTTTATIENNSVALIGIAGGRSRAIGIATANSAAATVSGNDVNDIGPQTIGDAGAAGDGIYTDTVATVNLSNNVIRQTTSGSTEHLPFRGILVSETASSLDQLTGEALVSGNMIYGNSADLIAARTGHCVLSANVCKQAADFPDSNTAAVVAVTALTCIASNNRVMSAGKLRGLSITVPGNKDPVDATVVGNIASISIELNGNPLPTPWKPLNVIA
jgi:Family of unknown function (DUF6519)